MQNQIDTISAIPSKRLFLSIIADYDLNKAICELVDNALDMWIKKKCEKPLIVKIFLEKNQQTIKISDNSGGVKKEALRFIVGPGHTTNDPTEQIIGVFGVGTKRALLHWQRT